MAKSIAELERTVEALQTLKEKSEALITQLEADNAALRAEMVLPRRRKLSSERVSRTIHFVIHAAVNGEARDEDGYIIIGFYDNGEVGEFFIRMAKQGSTVSGFVDQWAIACSLLLQTGTPLEDLCKRFMGTRFEPSGRTNMPEARVALSVVDMVAKLLYYKFVVKKLPEAV